MTSPTPSRSFISVGTSAHAMPAKADASITAGTRIQAGRPPPESPTHAPATAPA